MPLLKCYNILFLFIGKETNCLIRDKDIYIIGELTKITTTYSTFCSIFYSVVCCTAAEEDHILLI